jgi:hypothetical protein
MKSVCIRFAPLALLLALPTLGGAYDDGCIITITPIEECELDCELLVDDDGDELCECAVPLPCVLESNNGEVLEFAAGEIVSEDACGFCRCRADGAIICEELGPDECGNVCVMDDGTTLQVGDSIQAPDGCNTCFCDEGGFLACTEMWCGCDGPDDPGCGIEVCEYNGQVFHDGDVFDAGDGCNTCECWDGAVFCTEMACPPPPDDVCITGNGDVIAVGETVDAGNGCNTCSCVEGGFLACTLMACPVCEHPDESGECAPHNRCDGPVFCDMVEPQCDDDELPEIADGCYTGDCIQVELCWQ